MKLEQLVYPISVKYPLLVEVHLCADCGRKEGLVQPTASYG